MTCFVLENIFSKTVDFVARTKVSLSHMSYFSSVCCPPSYHLPFPYCFFLGSSLCLFFSLLFPFRSGGQSRNLSFASYKAIFHCAGAMQKYPVVIVKKLVSGKASSRIKKLLKEISVHLNQTVSKLSNPCQHRHRALKDKNVFSELTLSFLHCLTIH